MHPWEIPLARTPYYIYIGSARVRGNKRNIPVYAVSRISFLVAKTISEREISDKSSRKSLLVSFLRRTSSKRSASEDKA